MLLNAVVQPDPNTFLACIWISSQTDRRRTEDSMPLTRQARNRLDGSVRQVRGSRFLTGIAVPAVPEESVPVRGSRFGSLPFMSMFLPTVLRLVICRNHFEQMVEVMPHQLDGDTQRLQSAGNTCLLQELHQMTAVAC